jgi:hypothetical protein
MTDKTDGLPNPPIVSNRMGKRFQCLGSSCPDTCCNGLSVEIDRRSYEAYRNSDDPQIRLIASTHIEKTMTNARPSDANFAKIKTDGGEYCPFLTQEKLCQVQASLGEQSLSPACTVYPRELYKSGQPNDPIKMYLNLSCPEAARLCVSDSHALDSDALPGYYFNDKGPVIVRQMTPGRSGVQSMTIRYIQDVVNQPSLGIFARYVAIRLFEDHVARLESSPEVIQVNIGGDLINHFRVVAHQIEKVQALSADVDYQADRLTEAWLLMRNSHRPAPGLIQLTHEITNILDSDYSRESLGLRLSSGLPTVTKILNDQPHAVSNIILNEFSRLVYREADGADMVAGIDEIFIRIGLVRLACAYLASSDVHVDIDRFAHIFALVSRALGHNRDLRCGLIKHLIPNPSDAIPTMGLLLALPSQTAEALHHAHVA